MNPEVIELTDSEISILNEIADTEQITSREALSRAIFFLASRVDYTKHFQAIK
jgi:hypothetical protein